MKNFVLFVLSFAVFATVGANTAEATGGYSTACTLSASKGDIVVNFNERMYSDYRTPNAYTRAATIPAGDYQVSLQSTDGYTGRSQSDASRQQAEQYFVNFRAGGSTVATSNPSQDLADGVEVAKWQGVVNDSLKITKDVNSVEAYHKAYPSNAPNSVTPICMVLKKKTPPVDPQCNPAINGQYVDEKPTTNLCAPGKSTTVTGSGTKVDPWKWGCLNDNTDDVASCREWCKAYQNPTCGNGKVETGEQCDDGNTTNGDGCSSQCKIDFPPSVCPYTASENQILVNFSDRLRSNGGTFEETVNANVPAGSYKVELASRDAYTGRYQTVQPKEQFKIILKNNGKEVATSASTPDLQDGVDLAVFAGVVNDNLGVAKATDTITARHSAYVDKSSANSLNPICARLTPNQFCGNGKVEAPEQCDDGNTNNGDGCSAQCTPEKASINIDKRDATDKDDSQTVEISGTAKFEIIVKNDGKVALKDVKVTDPREGACEKNIGDLAVGESKSYTCDSANVQEGFTNVAHVVGTPVHGGDNVTDKDPTKVHVPAPQCGNGKVETGEQCDDGNTTNGDGCSAQCTPEKASINIDKRDAIDKDDVQTVTQGEAAHFEIIVKNDGTVNLKDVNVTDPREAACVQNIGDLAVGESKTYTCDSANVQAAFTNIAHVVGTPVNGGDNVTDKDPTKVKVHVPGTPNINIDKHDATDGDDSQTVRKGEAAKFEIVVTNNGTVDLKDVTVTDPKESACNQNIGDLAVGESKTYTCDSANVQEGFTNVADVVGTPVDGQDKVEDTDPTDVKVETPGEPAIKIVKRDAADKDDQQTVEVGETANFEIIVTNTGSVDLKDVIVSDPKEPSCDKALGNLAVGESKSYTCSDTNVLEGYTNVADVVGTPVDDQEKVTDEDPSNVSIRTPQGPFCGNGIIEPGEECDGGSECNSSCEEEEEEEGECDASIGDRVWNDKNGNGVQEADEPGISGVKVKLVDGNEKDSDRTDSDGKYKFKNLCEGKVTVVVASETLPDGCWQTYDRDGKLDHTYKRDLEEGENYKKADFGYRCPGTVVKRTSPATGGAGAATGVATVLASGAAWVNYRRTRATAAKSLITFE